MIGTFSTAGFTREAWIEKRVAEGFTKEQAEHEFDSYTDPAIAKAQEQKVPTRGEMIQMINEAIMANIDKEQIYNSKTEEGLEMSFLISADEEEQIRQSEEYKQYMEEHKEENDNE